MAAARRCVAVRSKRSVLYSSPPPSSPPLLGAGEASGRTAGASVGTVERPSRKAAQGPARTRGVFWSASIVWTSGGRLRSRSALSSSTSARTGRPHERTPPSAVCRTRARSSREARIAAEVGAQDERVDEEADERLQLRPVRLRPACRRRSRPAPEWRWRRACQDGEEGHEERRLAAPRQAARPAASAGGRSSRRGPPRTLATGGRGRSAGRSRGRRAGEPLVPVGELGRERLAPQPGALPGREVGVLERQRGERRRPRPRRRRRRAPPARAAAPRRPAVGRDVVEGEEEHVLARRQPEQRGAEQRAAREVEAARPASRPASAASSGRAAPRRQAGRSTSGSGAGGGGGDLLPRLAVRGGDDRVRSASWRRTTSARAAASAAGASGRAGGSPGGCCRSGSPAPSRSKK